MNSLNSRQTAGVILFLAPFFLYEERMLALLLFALGLLLIHIEKISRLLSRLDWRQAVFFTYMFHMLFGERSFAYVGVEPLFITEIVLAILVYGYRRELLQVHQNLFIYYLLVAIGLIWGMVYVWQYGISSLRDSLMLVYALWVPVIYHVFRNKRGYDLFFALFKLFIVLKAVAYLHEGVMILTGQRALLLEGFRFNVGYIVPSLIVMSLFLPLRHLQLRYKVLSLMMLPAIFTLFHRSIFLGIALALLFIFLAGRLDVRKSIFFYGTTALVLLASFLVYYNSQVEMDLFRVIEQKMSSDEGNISFRFLSWEKVMEKYEEHRFLGYGVGRPVMFVKDNQFYETINLDYFDIRDIGGNAQPHNSYINILARFGIFIFPLFLYALWKPVARMVQLVRQQKGPGDHYARFLLLAGFVLLMYVFAFFNVVLEAPHFAFLFWLAVAMMLSYGRDRNRGHRKVLLKRSSEAIGVA